MKSSTLIMLLLGAGALYLFTTKGKTAASAQTNNSTSQTDGLQNISDGFSNVLDQVGGVFGSSSSPSVQTSSSTL